jgi:CMP/dCMP kinase
MRISKHLTIAIDGHSSCGKSTLAKSLAKKLGYTYVDSGAMYRGIALYCKQHNLIQNGIPDSSAIEKSLPAISISFQINPETGLQKLILNGINVEDEIRKPEIAAIVSPIAAIPEVRKKLVGLQREMGLKGGIVMDGRDIGSVVFPNAEIKLFVTADPEIRAQRRYTELKEKGIEATLEATQQNLLERDQIDSERTESPLIQTSDAILLDNSHLNREEQLNFVLKIVDDKIAELS